jgi:hypothetical protein
MPPASLWASAYGKKLRHLSCHCAKQLLAAALLNHFEAGKNTMKNPSRRCKALPRRIVSLTCTKPATQNDPPAHATALC